MKEFANKLIQLSEFGATDYELNFKHANFQQWTLDNYSIPVISVIIYLIVVFGGSKIMATKKEFDLHIVLGIWSLFLSLFSAMGALRTVPYVIGLILKSPSYYNTICDNGNEFFAGPSGFWTAAFMLSKVPELLDTVFIVFRKKQLVFLHWYHHVSVLLYCWHAYSTGTGAGIIFTAMNYTVHCIMYFYYFMQAMRICPRSFPAQIITLVQITQMIVGVHICGYTCYYVYSGAKCDITKSNMIAAVLMYASYLYLFCEFAVKKYIFPSKRASKKVE